jgi:molybdopterin converting factor small subunit
MAKIKFTSALKPFFPSLTDLELEGSTVREIVIQVETRFPGISTYLMDETGSLRKHVNIFLQGDLIKDRERLSDSVKNSDEVLIFQALSGG